MHLDSKFAKITKGYTVIRFVPRSAKFGISAVVGLNETLLEDKMPTF